MSNDDQYLSNLGKTLSITANNILKSSNLDDIVLSPTGEYRKIFNKTMSSDDTQQAVQNHSNLSKSDKTLKNRFTINNRLTNGYKDGFQDISQKYSIDYFKNPYIDVNKTFKFLTYLSDDMLTDIDVDTNSQNNNNNNNNSIRNRLIKDSIDLDSKNSGNNTNATTLENPSLYQGFETLIRETFPASQNDKNHKGKMKAIENHVNGSNRENSLQQVENSPRKRSLRNNSLLNFDADIVTRSYSIPFLKNIKTKIFDELNLIKMKKKITSAEINEIDFKLQKLEMRRNLMFNKLADLENKQIILEQKIPLTDERINFLRDRQDMDYLTIDDNKDDHYPNDDDDDDDPNQIDIRTHTQKRDNFINSNHDGLNYEHKGSHLHDPNDPNYNPNDDIPINASFSNRSSTSFKSALFDNSTISYSINNNSIASQNNNNISHSDLDGGNNNTFQTKSLKRLHKFLRYSTNNYERTTPTLQQYYKPGSLIKTINEAHQNKINCLDFDIPFGTVYSTDNIVPDIKLWDLSEAKQIGILKGHSSKINCLEYDHKFNMLITGSDDTTLKLWDINKCINYFDQDMNLFDFGCLYTFDEHVAGITAININTHYILSGSNDLTVRQWDLDSGKCVQTLDLIFTNLNDTSSVHSHDNGTNNLDIPIVGGLQSFDAALATGTRDGIVRLWDLRNGEMVRTLEGHTDAISCLKFDLQNIITGSLDHTVRTWDLRSGLPTHVLNLDSPVSSIDFDENNIVIARHSEAIDVYNRNTKELTSVGNLESHAEVVKYKNSYLVEGRTDGTINSWAV